MTDEEARKILKGIEMVGGSLPEDGDLVEEALLMAIKALEQQPITWIVGKDNCQVAVRNMPIDKMQKICAIIGEKEQQPKTGHWIDVETLDSALWHECSECGETEFYATDYCPNCGAKMEVEENG